MRKTLLMTLVAAIVSKNVLHDQWQTSRMADGNLYLDENTVADNSYSSMCAYTSPSVIADPELQEDCAEMKR